MARIIKVGVDRARVIQVGLGDYEVVQLTSEEWVAETSSLVAMASSSQRSSGATSQDALQPSSRADAPGSSWLQPCTTAKALKRHSSPPLQQHPESSDRVCDEAPQASEGSQQHPPASSASGSGTWAPSQPPLGRGSDANNGAANNDNANRGFDNSDANDNNGNNDPSDDPELQVDVKVLATQDFSLKVTVFLTLKPGEGMQLPPTGTSEGCERVATAQRLATNTTPGLATNTAPGLATNRAPGLATNTAPAPGLATNTAPAPGLATNTAPAPGLATNTPGLATNTAPGLATNTAPAPGLATNTTPGLTTNTAPAPGLATNTAPAPGLATNTTPGLATNTAAGLANTAAGLANTAPAPGLATNTGSEVRISINEGDVPSEPPRLSQPPPMISTPQLPTSSRFGASRVASALNRMFMGMRVPGVAATPPAAAQTHEKPKLPEIALLPASELSMSATVCFEFREEKKSDCLEMKVTVTGFFETAETCVGLENRRGMLQDELRVDFFPGSEFVPVVLSSMNSPPHELLEESGKTLHSTTSSRDRQLGMRVQARLSGALGPVTPTGLVEGGYRRGSGSSTTTGDESAWKSGRHMLSNSMFAVYHWPHPSSGTISAQAMHAKVKLAEVVGQKWQALDKLLPQNIGQPFDPEKFGVGKAVQLGVAGDYVIVGERKDNHDYFMKMERLVGESSDGRGEIVTCKQVYQPRFSIDHSRSWQIADLNNTKYFLHQKQQKRPRLLPVQI